MSDVDADYHIDASPEAGVPIECTTYDFCALPSFRLPITAEDIDVFGISLWGSNIAYNKAVDFPFGDPPQIFSFDLERCVECKLTSSAEADGQVNLWQDEIYFENYRGDLSPPQRDIFRYSFESSDYTALTESDYVEQTPFGNNEFVIFKRCTSNQIGCGKALILFSVENNSEIELAPDFAVAAYYDISDAYVVYSAYTGYPQSVGRDVFYYDLFSQQNIHLETTMPGYHYGVQVWGDYITWYVSDFGMYGPFYLMLYHIPSSEEVLVSDGGEALAEGRIHERIIAYNTNSYQGESMPFPSDIEIYDIDSSLKRRVTTQACNLRVADVFLPYLLVVDVRSFQNNNPWYIYNLVQLGIVDADGHVIEGEGVIDPPM
ncbi:hypothetical protein ACFL51_00580 [Myxococcota bacterium]